MQRYRRILKLSILFALWAVFALGVACQATPIQSEAPAVAPTPEPMPTGTIEPTPHIVVPATDDPTSLSADDIDGVVTDPSDVLPAKRSYEEMLEVNEDVVGWITIPNTQIDYPVVRGTDNKFYLTHNVEKEESKHGAVFMDYRNANPDQQLHLIIYGHNMKNGTMFHDLNNYKQRDFFDQNRRFTFIWQGAETEWEIYLACVWEWKDVYFHHTRFSEANPRQNFADIMNAIIEYAKKSKYSIVDENIIVSPSDYVLTLSTCTYEYDNSRFIVSARRVK